MKRRLSKIRPEKWFDIRTLVEAGIYSRESIYRFIKTKQLKAIRQGKKGKYFIRESDWNKFIEGIA